MSGFHICVWKTYYLPQQQQWNARLSDRSNPWLLGLEFHIAYTHADFAVLSFLQEIAIGDELASCGFKKKCKLIKFEQEFQLKSVQNVDIVR